MNPRRQRFVHEYLKDLNATRAAVRAGYSKLTADTQGPRLLENVGVRKAIDSAIERRSLRVRVTTDDVLRELLRLATVDLGGAYDSAGNLLPVHEMPEDVRRAIVGIKVFEEFEGSGDARVKVGEVREVKFADKRGALELLGKHLRMFTERTAEDDESAPMSDEEAATVERELDS